jgi:RNA polymerase sigma factor (sigma-70 family)
MEADQESSLDLIKRVQDGDASALDALIARYRPRMVRWASGRLPGYARDLVETQDLVQDTLVQAFRKIGGIEIRGEGALQAYLRQALLNGIRMEIRRVSRRPVGAELESGIESTQASPLELAIGAQTLTRYEQALEALRPEDRELVIAHVEFEFSHQELAVAFGKPTANAARMALQRALMQLAAEMKPGLSS